jgi:phosphatidate cytidylyltransferase
VSGEPSARQKELRTRFLIGPAIGLFIVGGFLLDSWVTKGWVSAIVLMPVAMLAVHEYVAMLRKGGFAVNGPLLYLATLALSTSAFFFGWNDIDKELYPLAIGTMLLLYPLAVRSLLKEHMAKGLEEQGSTLLGFTMISWPLFFAQGMALRHIGSLLFVMIVCKGGDSFAYVTGVVLGRKKLIPHISPGKTWEGSLGGVVGACVLAVAFRYLLRPQVELSLTAAVLTGIMLNVTTQTGDLIESLLKRRCGVKDSSTLLPYHGGILDLVDSLLFSFPAWFLVLVRLT